MSEMVERVAKAMCVETGTIWGGPRGEDDPDFLLTKLTYLSLARAAIEAMREPTEKMERAARVWSPSLRESYAEMIDAALAEN